MSRDPSPEHQDSADLAEAAKAIEAEIVYRGLKGRRRLADILAEGIAVRDVLPRLVYLIAGPHRDRAEALASKAKANAAERRILSRKVNQTPEVVVRDDLSLDEIGEILRLHAEGLTPTRIARLFEVPPRHITDIVDAISGKHAERVIYSAEMRRRRRERLANPRATSQANAAGPLRLGTLPLPLYGDDAVDVHGGG